MATKKVRKTTTTKPGGKEGREGKGLARPTRIG
jgi:hypothetical protein